MTSIDLRNILVRDCMHHGIVSCREDARLGEVAEMMATHRVHAVAVIGGNGQRPVAIVFDRDVAATAASGAEPTAREVAATNPLTIAANQPMHDAAARMAEHGVSHLVVVDNASGFPIGILSTLDVAVLYARAMRDE